MKIITQDFSFFLIASNVKEKWTQREGFLLSLQDDNGRIGQGEVCPLPKYSKETLAECKDELSKFQTLIKEKSIFDLHWQEIEKITTDFPAALRCGIECAYIQVLAEFRQETVWQTLRSILLEMGGFLAPIGAISLAFLFTATNLEELETEFFQAWEKGFRTFKMKIGNKSQKKQERQMLTWLEKNIGKEGRLRVDSNGVFFPKEVQNWANFLTKIQVEFWEEPGAIPVFPHPPLAQDESLLNIVPQGFSSILVLKPMLLGLFATMRLIAEYRDRNVVISHLFESAVGWNLSAALALALGNNGLAAGLTPHNALNEKDLIGFVNNRLEPSREAVFKSKV